MKKIYGLILFFSINLTPNFVQAQILKKIVNGVKEGAANLKEGDQVEWIDQGDGTWMIRKVTKPITMEQC